jgi:hypothetical protein
MIESSKMSGKTPGEHHRKHVPETPFSDARNVPIDDKPREMFKEKRERLLTG